MNAAVIVETRPIQLKGCLQRHLNFLPDFQPFIFTTTRNRTYFTSEADGYGAYFYYIKDTSPFTDRTYNELLTSLEFWNCFKDYERVLIFQHDSGILREGIDEFMQWDYVGAPWRFQNHGGNGGLSLRNPKKMIEVINTRKYHSNLGNEDVYFCNIMKDIAPREVCIKFSVESIYMLGTLGYHAIDRYLTKEQVNYILNQYKNPQKKITIRDSFKEDKKAV